MYSPDSSVHYSPEKTGYEEQDIEFLSSDETKLHGWFFKARSAVKGTIVQFHGNGQNLTSHYMTLAWLVDEGYNLFIFDYRGYGKSEGRPTPEGLYKDGMSALDKAWELHSKHAKNGQFIVYAQSLGVPVALRSLEDFSNRDKVSLVVADSGFISYKWVFAQTMAKHWLTLPFAFIPLITVSDKYAPRPEKLNMPVLVIHDQHDPIIKISNSQELYKSLKAKKWFWVTEEGYHIAIFFIEKQKNRIKFLELLNRLR